MDGTMAFYPENKTKFFSGLKITALCRSLLLTEEQSNQINTL